MLKKMKKKLLNNKANVLIQTLLSLLIVSIFIPFIYQCLLLLQPVIKLDNHVQNVMNINYLQNVLAFSSDYYIYDDYVIFTYNNQQRTIKLIDTNLVMTPGSQYLANNVDNIYFYQENNLLMCQLTVNNYERIICFSKIY